jgi:hypothetical protein
VNTSNPVVPAGAGEPLDELDERILSGINELWASADPMPASLVDRIQFAVDLENVDVEVLRLTELETVAAARGDELSRLITFDSDHLTIMVRVSANRDGTNRIDGWVTPAASHPIELRTGGGTLAGSSDAAGRFAFGTVPTGLAQFVVRPIGSAQTVTTPAISL